jgi:hypothetical protein
MSFQSLAQACLFLAAKVEEQPRKLEHVIKVFHNIVHREQGPLDTKSVVSPYLLSFKRISKASQNNICFFFIPETI